MPILEEPLEPGLLRWTIAHPARRNALDPAALAWIVRRSAELRGEVVILTGDGDRVFSAGFDLTALPELAAADPATPPDAPLIAAAAALVAADAAFIAAINGPAIGAAVELAACCDLRLACPAATFYVPAAKLGVVYHAAGLARLRAAFGAGLTRRLILLGDRVTADEALVAGFLARVVELPALPAAAVEVARVLRAGSPRSLRAHRDLLRLLDRAALPEGALAAHHDARVAAYAAADLEGARRRALDRSASEP